MPKLPTLQVGAAATLIYGPQSTRENQAIINSGSVTVWLGGSASVTTANGVPFPPNSKLQLFRNVGALYAIAAAGPPGILNCDAGAY